MAATPIFGLHFLAQVLFEQETQLSQRDRAILPVIEYFAKSLNATQVDSK